MDTIFINSRNSKTSDPQRLLLKLSNKIDLEVINKLLYQIVAFTMHGKKLYNRKFKISAPTWKDEFELPDKLYSALNIQDYFECISKRNMEKILIILQ